MTFWRPVEDYRLTAIIIIVVLVSECLFQRTHVAFYCTVAGHFIFLSNLGFYNMLVFKLQQGSI